MANAAATIQRIASQTQVQLQKMVNSSNELQSRYNAQEAQKSRDWQTNMSKSAHQMEVEDLKKAGLNPVLSSGGSGAQSYTTSSAAISPESGASAAAGVQESQIGALGNMESSRISAAATKKAAAVSAAAMRSAAATQAAAQMYAAQQQYKGQVFSSLAGITKKKMETSANIKIAEIGQGKSWSGFLDKYLGRTGLTGPSVSVVKTGYRALAKPIVTLVNNPSQYFNNVKNGIVKIGNFSLNSNGVKQVNKALGNAGLAKTASNRNLLIRAYVFKDNSARTSLANKLVSNAKAHQTKLVSPTTSSHKTRRSLMR